MKGTFIFIADRGFVIVGAAELDPQLAFHWKLSPGRTIRVWGTTNGLSELINGPTKSTILDPPAVHRLPFRGIIDIIEVKEEKWAPHLST